MAQQEGNSDLSTTFSTLNVNAMEFVPSFSTNAPSGAVPEDEVTPPKNATPVDETAVEPDTNTPLSQDTSPTKTNAEPPVSVPTTTEPMDDKSPDNPGICSQSKHIYLASLRFLIQKISFELVQTE